MSHEPHSPAEALGQAITRAEAAEAEALQLKIELEDAGHRCNRVVAQLRGVQDENRQLRTELEHAGNHCVQVAAQLRQLQGENAKLLALYMKMKDAEEAQAG